MTKGPLRLPVDAERGREGARRWARVHGSGGVAVAASERVVRMAAARMRLERLVAYATDPRQAPRPEAALEALEAAERLGVETLLAEQRSAWARRWSIADIRIEGDPDLQRAVRFCLFHLMASVADPAEAALGARGLSGLGYRGHVFWDTDIFVLPFLAATHPPAARALVGYRVQRLDAARTAAARGGFEGARFPWESAHTGEDVTPTWVTGSGGQLVRVLTGEQEEHITADVAWAVARYQSWSGDARTLGACRELLCETARYWASRMRLESDGVAHIDGVIGPDEYHESVDDNAFTNGMVRWNLLHAAEVGIRRRGGQPLAQMRRGPCRRARSAQRSPRAVRRLLRPRAAHRRRPSTGRRFRSVARRRAPAADPARQAGRRPHAPPARPGPRERRLSRRRHRLVRAPHDPRLIAFGAGACGGARRAGRLDDALAYLRRSATIDLDDRKGSTRDGLHFATMGGVWHALVHGVAGLELHGQGLKLHPQLPAGWEALEFQVVVQDAVFRFRVLPDRVAVRATQRAMCGLASAKTGSTSEPTAWSLSTTPSAGAPIRD